jgi:hypothetical protein
MASEAFLRADWRCLVQTTSRDAQIVAWLGRIGAAGAQHVRERFGVRGGRTYEVLADLTADGLLEHRMLLYARPGLYSATRKGLRWQGLHGFPVYQASPGGFEHAWWMASTAVELHRELPDWRLLVDRELGVMQARRKEPIAWAKVASSGSHIEYHRPDFALISPSGRVVAVEVELTPKNPRQLVRFCRGWARARHVEHVYYLATKKAGQAVKRAAEAVQAGDLITVLELDGVPRLARRELQIAARAERGERARQDGAVANGSGLMTSEEAVDVLA